jgi:hypothetical protein
VESSPRPAARSTRRQACRRRWSRNLTRGATLEGAITRHPSRKELARSPRRRDTIRRTAPPHQGRDMSRRFRFHNTQAGCFMVGQLQKALQPTVAVGVPTARRTPTARSAKAVTAPIFMGSSLPRLADPRARGPVAYYARTTIRFRVSRQRWQKSCVATFGDRFATVRATREGADEGWQRRLTRRGTPIGLTTRQLPSKWVSTIALHLAPIAISVGEIAIGG